MDAIMVGTLGELTGIGIEILVDSHGEFICEFYDGNFAAGIELAWSDEKTLVTQ